MQSPFRKPLPQPSQIPSYEVYVELKPSKTFRRNCPHEVHPPRDHSRCCQEATNNNASGKRMLGQLDDVVVEVRPGIIPGSDVHGLVVVQEVKRKGQHAVCPLVTEIECRGPAERGEQRIGRKRARRHLQESFREFKGFRPFVAIQPQYEVGLYVRYVPQNQIHVFGYMPDFVHPLPCACLRLVAQVEPRLNAGQDGFETIALEALKVRFRKKGETAFGDEVDTAWRHGLLNHVEVVVESDPEIGIVPAYKRSPKLLQPEPSILSAH